ncbi:MAG: OmpA family protein [Treponema sp.]|nr:OmpA family protein [Treponema sp.]
MILIKINGSALKGFMLTVLLLILVNGLYAQHESDTQRVSDRQSKRDARKRFETAFPNGNFWSLDGGFGVDGVTVDGLAFQLVIDPKLWLSPALMVGAKAGINYSTEKNTDLLGNILTLEGQVYMRWNFLRFGKKNLFNIFLQGGIGLVAAYRGEDKFLDLNDVTQTRGSVLADAALGMTIPLTSRLHIEPLIRAGYPHIWGASLTIGYKFPLPQSRVVETIRNIPPSEIVKVIKIHSIEFVLFGPDIGSYNIGVDRDAQQLNELVLNYTSDTLKENPDFRVRLEGHANPFTISVSEAEDLMALSNMRAHTIAEELRKRGVSDNQIVVVGFGGTRTATSEWDIRNRNRRVELMIIQVDLD